MHAHHVPVLLAAACLAHPAGAELRAEAITDSSAAQLLIGGPDAIGGVGDWYLANDVVEVIVDDPGREHAKLNHGGTIVDAGLLDRRDEDQFARLFPIVNLDQRVSLGFDRIRAEVNAEEGWARLVVAGSQGLRALPRGGWWSRQLDLLVPEPEELAEVFATTEYTVFRGEPFVHIATRLENRGASAAPVFAYGDVWMRGGRSMRSFVGNALDPQRSQGFQHAGFDRSDLLGGEPMPAFTHVTLPGAFPFAPIAYAIFAPERAAQGKRLFGVTGQHVNLIAAFVEDPGWEELDLLRLGGAILGELEAGETWVLRRRLLVTGTPDVASTTDLILPLLGVTDGRSGIVGRVDAPGLRVSIAVDAADGAPVTQIAPPAAGPGAGTYRAALPPGEYDLTFRAPQRPPRRVRVEVGERRFAPVAPQRFEQPGWLSFDPAFSDRGPGRVVVRGLAETPDPVFEPELLGFRIAGEPAQSGTERRDLYFVGNRRDPPRVAIPPGRYELTATRGYEWDVARMTVEIRGPGQEVRVPPFELARVIELRGIVSADLHVHAQASDDSGIPNETRLRSYAAEAVDVMVSTDHDHLGFFDSALDALELRGRVRVIVGTEVTSSTPSPEAPWTLGHHNAWPIPYQPTAHRKGAPPSQNRGLAELYGMLRRDFGARVVQLNHPRDGTPGSREDGAYLTHLARSGEAFRPELPLEAEPNRLLLEAAADGTRPIDFDAMEVMNGDSFAQYLLIREDWYSLLRQGFRRTGTANSDSHGPFQLAAYPRNYVYLEDGWDPVAFDDAVRAGRLFGSNGPLIAAFTANGARMGEVVAAPDGRVEVHFAVAAPPWVPVDEVRLLVNGEVRQRYGQLPGGDEAPTMRLDERIELPLGRDAFLTLEAGAPLDADPVAWAASHPGVYADVVAPGFVPTAFANPIFVDVDDNGRFDPPGLPPPPTRWGQVALWLLVVGALGALLARARRGPNRTASASST